MVLLPVLTHSYKIATAECSIIRALLLVGAKDHTAKIRPQQCIRHIDPANHTDTMLDLLKSSRCAAGMSIKVIINVESHVETIHLRTDSAGADNRPVSPIKRIKN